jgi:hypothetical protein
MTATNEIPKQYGRWLSKVRYIGYYDGMAKRDVDDQINSNTIEDMFMSGVTPRDAYDTLMMMTVDERSKVLEGVISEAKRSISDMITDLDLGDHEAANSIKNAATKLHKLQKDYNRIYTL